MELINYMQVRFRNGFRTAFVFFISVRQMIVNYDIISSFVKLLNLNFSSNISLKSEPNSFQPFYK